MNLIPEHWIRRLAADVTHACGWIEDTNGPRPLTWPELVDRAFTDTWANYIGLVNGMHAQWRQTWL